MATDGKAPTPEVKGIFAKIHKAMRDVYQVVKGSGLLKPSKAVSELFDSWYGKHPEEAAKVEVESKTMLPREGAGEKSAQPSTPPAGTRYIELIFRVGAVMRISYCLSPKRHGGPSDGPAGLGDAPG